MCGLAAVFQPDRPFTDDDLAPLAADLVHRGPDGTGLASGRGYGLAHTRLAILDPGHRSDQPMSDPAGVATLVFNGEIYNFKALRAELEAAGHSFRTNGDTEVLLMGYLNWGDAVLERLEGMFAFVLIDHRLRRALVARDGLGIKPLYVRPLKDGLAVASEMRPLLRFGPAEPDPAALAELLVFGFAAGSLSNLQGIERLPPGTALSIDLDLGTVTRRRWFDLLDTLAAQPAAHPERTEAEVAEALEASLTDHLQSDVGYALQLSGGVDSSLIAALARRHDKGGLHAYAIDLGELPQNERPWRDQVAGRLALERHEIAFDGVAFADALPRAVRHMEGPVPHGGCVLLMKLCDHIARRTKVVLTGEGADEFFGGYARYGDWHKLARQEALGQRLPAGLLPDRWPFKGMRRLAGRDGAAWASVYADPAPLLKAFPDLVPVPGAREAASARFADFRDRLLAVDQTCYLESLLVRQDKMSMAASVEARVPFVHLPLAKRLNRLPHSLRVPGGETKPLLKRIAGPLLPHELLHRRKVGLTLPYGDWCADPKALGRYLDDLPSGPLAAYAAPGALGRWVERFRDGDPLVRRQSFRLINLDQWLRTLGGAQSPEPNRINP
ncbi:asparagine synthase (glutamine-hydrolyzing) [Roseospirillum parvum]|uniref:asparagine synthase (glutamine-hydrolyzing) n=1 Tax=Roseospirillum parvum TaxID=83401 RepID=A0A1G7W0W0_9PROT|nr:asparagine synthase (glutamine-hydrolyzing) [Roseospirillum parvum]SDG65319.1 asparagine synthase (glutamine-hydrolysing) [Roseospirillum parvum]